VTSAGAVARIKRLLPGKTKVGHTGTLDPLASGLLVLLIGRSTRLSRYVTDLDKTYTATARFGAVSDTFDAEGDITSLDESPMPDESTIRAALPTFTGHLLQIPPMASALKRGGVRLYDLHRRGITVEREPRPVTIHSLDLVAIDPARKCAAFEISCTSGTYVRTLISDLANHLETGAYLTALRRTSVGHLTVEQASLTDDLSDTTLCSRIIQPGEVVAHLPRVEVGEEEELAVRRGRALPARGMGGNFRVERGGVLLGIYRDGEAEARAEVVLCGA
jgi:tRNA pseudouridine55 synthase